MPQWIHGRAEHILAKNPSMPKSEAFAIATQQSHAVGKSPKGYGTAQGRHTAKAKYRTPGDDRKTANPGGLDSPKMASFVSELTTITKSAYETSETDRAQQVRRGLGVGAAGLGGSVISGGLAAKALKRKPTSSDVGLFEKLKQQAPIPVHRLNALEDLLGPNMGQNAAYGKVNNETAVIMGPKMPQHPGVLAHELGHHQIGKNQVGRLVQNPVTTALGSIGGGLLGGVASGGLTGRSDNKTVRALGRWAPMIAGAPQIGYEGAASLLGLAQMRRAGASGAQIRRAAGQLLPAWGTYVAPKILGTGAAHLTQALATPTSETR